MKIRLENVRLAFPNLFEAKAAKAGQKAKYSAAFIFPKDHPAVSIVKEAMTQVAKAKWGDKWETVYAALRAADKLAVHDGDVKSEYAGYAGNLFVNASNEVRPLILGGGPDGKAPLSAEDGKPYSGCYVNALIEIWAQQHAEHGKRINASLMGVQFARDGERLSGGATAAADDFDAIPQTTQAAAASTGQGAASLF
jgi:hypothetical protein